MKSNMTQEEYDIWIKNTKKDLMNIKNNEKTTQTDYEAAQAISKNLLASAFEHFTKTKSTFNPFSTFIAFISGEETEDEIIHNKINNLLQDFQNLKEKNSINNIIDKLKQNISNNDSGSLLEKIKIKGNYDKKYKALLNVIIFVESTLDDIKRNHHNFSNKIVNTQQLDDFFGETLEEIKEREKKFNEAFGLTKKDEFIADFKFIPGSMSPTPTSSITENKEQKEQKEQTTKEDNLSEKNSSNITSRKR